MAKTPAAEALERIDPDLGTFIEVDEDAVLEAAAVTETGRLEGVPIAIKDLIDTAGLRTTYGSKLFADHVPERNAPVVDDLRSHGAVILGKTNLNEFAFGGGGYNPYYGTIVNPKDSARTAGGSSGGSAAAVAGGVCRLALGTDTSGSVRVPAACCGVYGMKLAHSPEALRGVFPLAPSYDSLGYLAAGVEDLQQVLGIAQLPDLSALTVRHIGYDIEVPPLPDEHWTLFRQEVRRVHGDRLRSDPRGLGNELRAALEAPPGDEDAARRAVQAWRRRFLEITADVDVLVGPMLDGAAPTIAAAKADYERAEPLLRGRLLRHTPVYNSLGWPALAVPTSSGSVQVAARPGSEAAILAVGRSIGLSSAQTVVG